MAYLASEMANVVGFERLCYMEFAQSATTGIPAMTREEVLREEFLFSWL